MDNETCKFIIIFRPQNVKEEEYLSSTKSTISPNGKQQPKIVLSSIMSVKDIF